MMHEIATIVSLPTKANPIFTRFMLISLMLVALTPINVFGAEPGQVFHLNEEYENGYGYSVGVRADDMLYIGGLTATDDEGNPVGQGDARKQLEVIYEHMEKVLKAHGATLKNIINETFYTTDFEKLGSVVDVRMKAYEDAGAAFPTLVGIKTAGFSEDYIIIEVSAIAYLGTSNTSVERN